MTNADLGGEQGVGESLCGEVTFELDLEIWEGLFSFQISKGLEKTIPARGHGHERAQGSPGLGTVPAALEVSADICRAVTVPW